MGRVREFLEGQVGQTFTSALDQVDRIIDGFQSPHLMELLATVDWLVRPSGPRGVEEIAAGLRAWPGPSAAGERKARLFKKSELQLATDRLRAHADVSLPPSDATRVVEADVVGPNMSQRRRYFVQGILRIVGKTSTVRAISSMLRAWPI